MSFSTKHLCEYCEKNIVLETRSGRHWKDRKFCSQRCYWDSKIGKKLSLEHRKKIGDSHRGELSYQWKGGRPKCACGKQLKNYYARECNFCFHLRFKEEGHILWQGGITNRNKLLRNRKEQKDWRKAIFERDNFTCQACGVRGVELHADHIKPFALFPELRLDLNNGRTLCVPCHKKTPTFLRKLTLSQLETL